MPARRWEAAAIVGRTFGGFIVREPLSSGGFGMVFRAEQPALQRQAVVKVLHTHLLASESVVHRFLREAQLASRLDHPYAAHIYAFGAEPDGVLWIAMELVRGTPLDRLLAMQGPIPLERFVPLLERICEVVQSAHDQGIVHRDLKPGNVMVLARAGRLLPKLLDLGIAKGASEPGRTEPDGAMTPPAGLRTGTGALADSGAALDETALGDTGDTAMAFAAATPASLLVAPLAATTSSAPAVASDSPSRGAALAAASSGRLTHVGATMGSPLYMAPEQWDDAGAADQRTDLYALGVLTYEALTARTPFNGDSHMQIAAAHAMLPVPPLGGELPAELDAVLARALAKKPDDRYGSVLEFAAAFRAASGIASESVALPHLDEDVHRAALAHAPQPLAEALTRLDAARNAHQARDALWQVARTAARLVGVLALACHSHVHADLRATDPGVGEALRRLRSRTLSDEGWLELARGLAGPFASMRDAHPLPELVDLILGDGLCDLEELLALKSEAEASGGVSEDRVRELLERAVPLCSRALAQLAFLDEYPLVVPRERGAEEWMGLGRAARPLRRTARPLPLERPVLLDATGVPVVALWPFLQVHEPAPGEPAALFFFDGRGRRGARLTALPSSFEVEDEALWESLGGMLGAGSDTPGSVQTEEVCPFPGLASFGPDDAANFIGRERETEAFLNRLRVTPLLAVVGPSGAGKSSFVHAGVLAGLPDDWETISVRPGPAPLVSLAARLGARGIDVAGLRSELEEHPGALGQMLRAHAAARGVTLVLVVDQLEELFTLCDEVTERQLYAEALGRAARSADDPVRVIVTLRDDFLLRAEALPALRSRLGPALQLITTPAAPDLRRILTVPIQRAGYEFDDPALPDEMVEEVSGTPAALALLSFTASKLWELRDRRFRQIAHKAYRSLGGVGGALARHAEATLQALHPEEQRLVREVFRHAVTAEGTRAVLTRDELDQVLGGGAHAQAAVEKLVAARLLVVSEGEGGGERIEVTHEALLDAWPRLVAWRREDAEGARLRDQLRAAARQWDERDRPSGLLWRGDALAEYRLWRARYPGSLTDTEEAFAAASLAEAARGRRLRRLSVALIIVGLASVAVVLLFQNKRVAAQRSAARESAGRLHDLLLSQFENQGRRLVLADDPLQALAYLYQAARLGADSPAHDFLVAEAVRATDGEVMALEHGHMVGRARYSPDGTMIATTGYDDQAVLWDARTGAVRAHLRHKGPVVREAWSPDSNRIATGGQDNTVVVWDSHTGKAIRRLEPGGTPQVVAFSPDGTKLLVDTTRDQVMLYDPVSGKLVYRLATGVAAPLHLPIGLVAGFSPDGTLVAAGDNNGVVTMWDVATGHPVARMVGHHDALNWVTFSPDGSQLAAASHDQTVSVWDVRTHRQQLTLRLDGPVETVLFSPDGKRLVTADDGREAVVWDGASGKRLVTLGGFAGSVFRAVWSPDGRQIATGSDDATVELWDAATGRRLARHVAHRGAVHDVEFDPSGHFLVSASLDHRAIVWTADPAERVTRLRGHSSGVYAASFDSTGTHVLTASIDGTARVWDAGTGSQVLLLKHAAAVVQARFSPDDQRIATADADHVIRLWDARSGTMLTELKGHTEAISTIRWSPDGARLVSSAFDGTVRIWSVKSGEQIRSFKPSGGRPLYWASYSPSGRLISTVSEDKAIKLWDAQGRHLVRTIGDNDTPLTAVFDPTGTFIASATVNNRSATIRRVDTGELVGKLLGHLGNVLSTGWSKDDHFLITSSMDGTTRIWSADSGELLQVFRQLEERWVIAAAFAPDGGRIVTASGDGIATIWELPHLKLSLDQLAKVVRCRVPYELEGDRIVARRAPVSSCGRLHTAQ